MAKWTATETAQRVIDSTVQIFGALGVVRTVPLSNTSIAKFALCASTKARPKSSSADHCSWNPQDISRCRVSDVTRTSSRLDAAYRKQILVRLGDCDPAGIVFYPRYLDMFNTLVEDWCREKLDFFQRDCHASRMGAADRPSGSCDFCLRPAFLGMYLLRGAWCHRDWQNPRSIWTSCCKGLTVQIGYAAAVVLVVMDRKQGRGIPIPDEVRAKVSQFQITAQSRPYSARCATAN